MWRQYRNTRYRYDYHCDYCRRYLWSCSSPITRNETLYVGGFQWQPPVNFNILNNNPDWPNQSQNVFFHIYESLFAYNQLSGNLDPLLAKELKTPDATTMVVTLQDGTTWQDGQPLTPADVVYTYGLAKTQTDINYNTLFNYITSITATGDRTLEIKLNPNSLNPGIVKNYLTFIRILPQHIWQAREASGKLSAVVDTAPVGSGPYKLMDFSTQRIALQRNDNYWGKTVMGGLPAPKYIVHTIVKSNDDGNLAQGDLGASFSQYPTPVGKMIGQSLPWTLALQLPAILIGWVIGNVLGVLTAYRKGWLDKIAFPVSLFISNMPFYCLSILLLYLSPLFCGFYRQWAAIVSIRYQI